MNRCDRVDEWFARIEKFVVVLMLGLMILLAFSQIVLRNFFATGLSWADAGVRYLVLWVGFIGAALATRENKHITIEVFSRWFTGRARIYLNAVSSLCSTLICGLLTFAAIRFIQFEAQMGSTILGGLAVWLPELILPITFGLMTFRFALRFVKELINIKNPGADSENKKDL